MDPNADTRTAFMTQPLSIELKLSTEVASILAHNIQAALLLQSGYMTHECNSEGSKLPNSAISSSNLPRQGVLLPFL
jgi:hypothetical protein